MCDAQYACVACRFRAPGALKYTMIALRNMTRRRTNGSVFGIGDRCIAADTCVLLMASANAQAAEKIAAFPFAIIDATKSSGPMGYDLGGGLPTGPNKDELRRLKLISDDLVRPALLKTAAMSWLQVIKLMLRCKSQDEFTSAMAVRTS